MNSKGQEAIGQGHSGLVHPLCYPTRIEPDTVICSGLRLGLSESNGAVDRQWFTAPW